MNLSKLTTDDLINAIRQHGETPRTYYRAKLSADVLTARRDLSAVSELLPLLLARSKFIRECARDILVAWGDEPEVRAAIRDLLRTETGIQSLSVLEMISSLRDTNAIPIIAEKLPGADHNLQQRMLKTLGELGDETAIPTLVDATALNGLRMNALTAMGHIASDLSLYVLLDALTTAREATIRNQVIAALGTLGDARAVTYIADAVHDERRRTRRLAIRTLCEIGGTEATDVLVALLAHDDPNCRQEATTALAALGDATVAPKVAMLLGDFARVKYSKGSPSRVHGAARDALIVLGRHDLWHDWQRRHPRQHLISSLLRLRDVYDHMGSEGHFTVFLVGACLFVFAVLYWLADYSLTASLWRSLVPALALVACISSIFVIGGLLNGVPALDNWLRRRRHTHKPKRR